MPGPRVNRFIGDESLPGEVDCVVIGGGIIGTSAALELAEAGVRVALCEKGWIGHEQSSRNWGWVRLAERDSREVDLMIAAHRIWDGLAERTGHATGLEHSGIAFGAFTQEQMDANEQWLKMLDGRADVKLLSAREVAALYPEANLKCLGALYAPNDARAEPQWVAPAIAEAARQRGAHVLTECAVRGIERQAGKVGGVITELGSIRCERVLLAGGAWSSLFTRRHGVELPQLKVLNPVLRTTPVDGGPQTTLWTNDFAVRRRADGGYTVAAGDINTMEIVPDAFRYFRKFWNALRRNYKALSFHAGLQFCQEWAMEKDWAMDAPSPFEYHRVLDPVPWSAQRAGKVLEAAAATFPALKAARIAQRWAGYIDVTPDAVPAISPVDEIPGLFIATGFSGHGFGIGPGAGRLAADLVLDRQPVVDPYPFRMSRFSDGTPLIPETGP